MLNSGPRWPAVSYWLNRRRRDWIDRIIYKQEFPVGLSIVGVAFCLKQLAKVKYMGKIIKYCFLCSTKMICLYNVTWSLITYMSRIANWYDKYSSQILITHSYKPKSVKLFYDI